MIPLQRNPCHLPVSCGWRMQVAAFLFNICLTPKGLHLAPVWNSCHTLLQGKNRGVFSFEWFFERHCKKLNYWASLDRVLNHQYSALIFTHMVLVWFVTFAWFFRDFEAPDWLLKEVFAILCKASVLFAAIKPGLEAHSRWFQICWEDDNT